MGRRVPNPYAHPAQQLSPQDLAMAERHFGATPKMGPPAPTADDMFGGERYPDGRLKDPMEMAEHGRASPHAQGGRVDDFKGVMDEKWDEFKAKIGAGKAMAGKVPPKSKLPKGEPPKEPEKVIAASAAAHTPDDDQALKELKGLIDKYEGKKKLDLSPLLALTDSWTGSRLQQGYDAPLGDDEREKIVMSLRSKLVEQKENLDYKREYLTQQREDAALRRKFQEEKAKEDRDTKITLARLRGDQQAAGREAASGQKDISNKSRFLKENKTAVKAIAKKRFGNSADPEDRSYELRLGPLNDEIYEFGKHLEEEGQVAKGMGYNTALEFYLTNASGPDGAE